MSFRLSYLQRAQSSPNELTQKLFLLMHNKQSNLALSADVTHSNELIDLADKLGSEICVLKTHIDIVADFTPALVRELRSLAEQHQFLIFEDRKFADIGNTVKHQYQGGVYQIADWADIVNAHSLPGPGIIEGLAAVGLKKQRGLLMLAEMSSADNLLDSIYAQKTLQMAEKYPDFVMGFISQHKLNEDPRWIYLTPGVSLAEGNDSFGQQYNTPEKAIIQNGTDIIIVGRGIIRAADPLLAAKKYRAAGWEAYLQAINYS